MNEKFKSSANGVTVEIEVENGKSFIRAYGKVNPMVKKAVAELQYSLMPPQWVMRQVMKIV
ncbi:MAG: hypothetical protein MJY87_02500 [Fibrobacter sp.]|nr:hypothetical protein [Fibrobacter sp.]